MIMTRSKACLWGLIALAGAVQTAALAKIVIDRQTLLTKGREIIIKTVPVDPRDLFRGDYVILGYNLNPVDSAKLKDPASAESIAKGSQAFLTIAEEAGHVWTAVRLTASYPETVAANEAVLKGLVEHRWTSPAAQTGGPAGTTLSLRYGIESYFVPEGTGRLLEQMVRDEAVETIVAVGADGTAAIKGLIVKGERREDPPLY